MEGVKTYPGRNYAFITMSSVSAAVAALSALHGTPLGGPAVRIEFAKTGAPSHTLLVSHVSGQFPPDVWAQQFSRYGVVTSLQFNVSQASCLVEFSTMAEAVSAHNALQGQVIADQALVISFAPDAAAQQQRVQPGTAPASMPQPPALASGKHLDEQSTIQPSKIVWVGLPNGTQITKRDLVRTFSVVGGLEDARAFSTRNYAFLHFATTEDAARCIQQMQGCLLSTPNGRIRLTLKFSSGSASTSTHASAHQGSVPPASRSRRSRSRSRSRSPLPRRSKRSGWDQVTPAGDGMPRSSLPLLPPPPPPPPTQQADIHQVLAPPPSSAQAWPAPSSHIVTGVSAPPPLAPVFHQHMQPVPSAMPLQQQLPVQMGQPPLVSSFGGALPGGSQMQPHASPLPVELGGPGWKGRIAKSGAPVCSLACVRGVPGQLPVELNCAARTELQSLAAHLQAVPHRVIQLAPASATDVAPLHGFITYLRDRERAGVVNVGDTTLFLVPPSEWAGRVLGCEPTANLIVVLLAAAEVTPVLQPAALPTATDLARIVALAGGAYVGK